MPLALLLSPDDQAVSAITAVLEEMSVTCERPLDGVSAAKQLNSHSFDLVLVDCENLPAAKLIFDVCRRGKGGNNPVPIAIVDGRAGLPTAFRLGAELILTKPVAKDQARVTVRTAVSRVKKEEPVRAGDPININAVASDAVPMDAPQINAGETNQESLLEPTTQAMPEERAMAAAAGADSCQLTSYSDPVSVEAPSAPASMAMAASAPVAEAGISVAPATEGAPAAVESKPSFSSKASLTSEVSAPEKLSDDPVLAELERSEAEAKPQPAVISSTPTESKTGEGNEGPSKPGKSRPVASEQPQKTRGPLVALLALLLVCAGFYAAWMYEPGFRAIAQPQVDRVLSLVGVAGHAQTPTSTPVKPAGQFAQPVSANRAGSDQSSAVAPKPSPSVTTALPGAGEALAGQPSAAASPAGSAPSTAPAVAASGAIDSTAAPAVKPGVTRIDLTKGGATQKSDDPSAAGQNAAHANEGHPNENHPNENPGNAGAKNISAVGSSDAELPGEKTAVILSSQGAEKRLMHSVQPTYPAGTHTGDSEGTMVLKAVVDEDGKVSGARVIEGNRDLASAAISAVKQWRYRPYLRDGKAQPFQTVVLVDFQRP